MEELLKNISGSKTFSIPRNPKKSKEFLERADIFYDAERHGMDQVPVPKTGSSGKRPEANNKTTITNGDNSEIKGYSNAYNDIYLNDAQTKYSNYADFIMKDQNVWNQRRILLQQERLQKQSIAAWTAASNTKKLNTKGLIAEEETNDKDEAAEFKDLLDVTKWPQYEDSVMARMQEKQENRQAVSEKRGRSKRFWSALFPEATDVKSESRKRRIFADPAYILHLSILKVKDEREGEAIEILKKRLASLSLLKKSNLKSMVNELFLRAMDKGFEDLLVLLIDSGFPENFNHSIYGDAKSRRFPSYLLLAIGLGRFRVVQRMLEVQPRAQMNKGWFNGIRPLMMAQMTRKVTGQSFCMTQLLLKHGAEPNRSISYSTYLRAMSFRNHKKNRCFINKNKSKNVSKKSRGRREIYRKTRLYALDFACSREKYESAHLMFSGKNSAEWLARNEFCLLELDNFELAADILQRVPELIKQRDARGSTPLHWAAKNGRTDLLALYLQYTSTVNVLNSLHWTPLHEAAAGSHRAAVQYLISHGADCSIKNIEGKTALQVAREQGISSEELYDFFHSADTIHRTQKLLGELVIPSTSDVPATIGTGNNKRLLIQKFMNYPRKLWKKSFKLS